MYNPNLRVTVSPEKVNAVLDKAEQFLFQDSSEVFTRSTFVYLAVFLIILIISLIAGFIFIVD